MVDPVAREAETATPAPKPAPAAKPASNAEGARTMVLAALDALDSEGGWVGLGALGQFLVRADPDFDSRTFGHKKLSDLIRALPILQVKSDDGTCGCAGATDWPAPCASSQILITGPLDFTAARASRRRHDRQPPDHPRSCRRMPDPDGGFRHPGNVRPVSIADCRGIRLAAADFSLAIAIQNLAWGIGQPLFGALAEKLGDRKAIIAGAVFYAAGLVGLRSP